jgi:hypothetical protein
MLIEGSQAVEPGQRGYLEAAVLTVGAWLVGAILVVACGGNGEPVLHMRNFDITESNMQRHLTNYMSARHPRDTAGFCQRVRRLTADQYIATWSPFDDAVPENSTPRNGQLPERESQERYHQIAHELCQTLCPAVTAPSPGLPGECTQGAR